MKSLVTALSLIGALQTAALAEPPRSHTALVTTARLALRAGEYEVAEQAMRVVVGEYASVEEGERSIDLQNLGLVLYSENKFQDAAEAYLEALPLTENYWGASSLAVADNLYGLIRAQRRASCFAEAEPHMLRILEIRKQQLGDWHKSVGNSFLDLAVNYERQGKFAEAESACARAVTIKEKQFGKESRDNIPYLTQHLRIIRKLNRIEEANTLDDRIKVLSSRPPNPEPPNYDDKSGWLTWPVP